MNETKADEVSFSHEIKYVFYRTVLYEIWRLYEEIYDEVHPDKTPNTKVMTHFL